MPKESLPGPAADPEPLRSARAALVHDWLTGMRGGEKVLEVLCELLPQADVFTLFQVKGSVKPALEDRVAGISFLGRLPALGRYYRYLLPLFPLAVEGLRLDGYDPIVSVSHCVAKGVLPPPASRHVCYCLTPMRYCWDLFPLYFGSERPGRAAFRPFSSLVAHYLRLWDLAASSRVKQFIAVSNFVAARIRTYYGRRAAVIYPPVDLKRFQPASGGAKDFYLVVAPDAPNKRIDLVLEAFRRLDRPVKIVGGRQGPRRDGRSEGPGARNVEWLGWVSEQRLADLYAHCRALVSAGLEDFGMAPVEAQACGRPVIAYGAGGALESVRGIQARDVPRTDRGEWLRRGYTAVLFDRPTGQALADAVECFEKVEDRFPVEVLREWAGRFDRTVFEEKWRRLLSGLCGGCRAGI